MSSEYFVILLLAFLNCSSALNSRANVTLADLTKCKEYSIKSGYLYRDYFDIKKLNNPIPSDDENEVRLRFYAQAPMDAHIRLTKSISPRPSDKVYEIAIGAGGNTYSFMRLQTYSPTISRRNKSNTMSVWDPTLIEVILRRNNGTEGKLTVNLVGLDEPHLEYTDSNLMEVNYFAFSSWGDSRARWYYDCSKSESGIKIPERKLPDDMRLIKHLSPNREMPPADLKNIQLNFVLKEVAYDHKIMSTRCGLFMSWIDSRLQWNPSDYGNLTFIKSYILWKPKLRVDNGIGDIPGYFHSTIYHNGTVTARNTDAQIDTLCPDVENPWPYGSIDCRIEISVANSEARLYNDIREPIVVPTMAHVQVLRVVVELEKDTYGVTLTLKEKHV